MGSKTKTPTGGDKKQTPGEQVLNNFLQFTNTRPNTKSKGMTLVSPDGTTAGFNYGFDQTMSDLLAGARSGRNNPPPSQTMPPVMLEAPPSQTMPPVFIPPQSSPNRLFKDSVLNTLETDQLPPSVRDESIPLPGIDLRERFRGFETENPPRAFTTPPPPTTPSGRNLLPFLLPLPVGLGSLFREFLLNQQEDS